MAPDDGLRMKDECVREFMVPWLKWLPPMPEEVQQAWAEFNEREGQNE